MNDNEFTSNMIIEARHELANESDEYRWYYMYSFMRPNLGETLVACSKEDAVRVWNLKFALGVFSPDLIASPLPTKVRQRYIDEYHLTFDSNKFILSGLPMTEKHMEEIREHQLLKK